MSRLWVTALRLYLLAAGLLLLVQGAASLLVRAVGNDPHQTSRLLSDPGHATIHLLWGVGLLAVLAFRAGEAAQVWVTFAFGVFYVGLLAVGLAVHHPFGLMIDGGENAFHAVIGPLALILSIQAALHPRHPASAAAGTADPAGAVPVP